MTELNILVVMMYSFTFLYLCEFALAVVNTWKFLIKQKKYQTWPLLVFYLLTMMLSLTEAVFNVFLFYAVRHQSAFLVNMRPIIKLELGIIQCWILFELALRITQDLNQTDRIQKSIIG